MDGVGRAATPEPSRLQLLGSGVLGLSGLLRKQLVTAKLGDGDLWPFRTTSFPVRGQLLAETAPHFPNLSTATTRDRKEVAVKNSIVNFVNHGNNGSRHFPRR